jgi:hypothetical protein
MYIVKAKVSLINDRNLIFNLKKGEIKFQKIIDVLFHQIISKFWYLQHHSASKKFGTFLFSTGWGALP